MKATKNTVTRVESITISDISPRELEILNALGNWSGGITDKLISDGPFRNLGFSRDEVYKVLLEFWRMEGTND